MGLSMMNVIIILDKYVFHNNMCHHILVGALPLIMVLAMMWYYGHNRRCDRIYEEMRILPKKKKRVFRILVILEIVIIWVVYVLVV